MGQPFPAAAALCFKPIRFGGDISGSGNDWLGLTRLAMMRYGIDDIRLLQGGDLRFLSQF